MTDVSLLQAEITRLQAKCAELAGAKETAEMHMRAMAEELEKLRQLAPVASMSISPTLVGYQCIRGCGRIAESGLVCEECQNAKSPSNPAGDGDHLHRSPVDGV